MTYDELLEKIKADHVTAEQFNAAGGIREEVTQSDKIGYDWRIFYVNDIAVRKDYVEQEIPFGTADNPIIWKEGMSLIPNAYYTHNDVRKVWTGDAGAMAAWDDDNFVEL